MLKFAIKTNSLYYYILEASRKELKNNHIDKMNVDCLISNLMEKSEVFRNIFQAALLYYDYILIASLIWIILFKSKHSLIRAVISLDQLVIIQYIKYHPLFYNSIQQFFVVNRLFIIIELLALIYNIKWLYEKYSTQDMTKNTLSHYLIHINSIGLILGWILCLVSSFITERLFSVPTTDNHLTITAFFRNLSHFILGIEMIILGNAVHLGKTLSEIILYPINKEFFCYSSNKYKAFIKVVGNKEYKIIN